MQTLNEKEEELLNEIYSNFLERVEKNADEGLYLEIANLLTCIYKYNKLFISYREKELQFEYEIVEERNLFISILND